MQRSARNGPDTSSTPLPLARQLHDLYICEAPRLSRFFSRRTAASDEVPDLVQEAFARFAHGAPAAAVLRPGAYLQRIARNLLFDRGRRHARRGDLEQPSSLEDVDLAAPADQGDAIDAAQLMETYQRALDALPPRTREVFLLHRVDELSYKAIAERLGIGVRTVEWHIAEALVRIRRILDEA